MAILGVESAIFGVDDIESCSKFWTDFGLTAVSLGGDECVFEVASGSKVVVRRRGDPRLPPAYGGKPGVHETIWGVDTAEALEKLVAGLAVLHQSAGFSLHRPFARRRSFRPSRRHQ